MYFETQQSVFPSHRTQISFHPLAINEIQFPTPHQDHLTSHTQWKQLNNSSQTRNTQILVFNKTQFLLIQNIHQTSNYSPLIETVCVVSAWFCSNQKVARNKFCRVFLWLLGLQTFQQSFTIFIRKHSGFLSRKYQSKNQMFWFSIVYPLDILKKRIFRHTSW